MAQYEPINDPSEPRVIWARSPERGTTYVRLGVHPDTIRNILEGPLNSKLGEYCGLVHGNVLGDNTSKEIKREGTTGLLRPTAIFRGLKRPMINLRLDEEIHIYVTNPVVNYSYPQDRQFADLGPVQTPVPDNSVFLTFVDFRPEAIDEVRPYVSEAGGELDGVVLFWEWTRASQTNPRYPYDYHNRYLTRVWP